MSTTPAIPPLDFSDLITLGSAARTCGVSQSALRRWVTEGLKIGDGSTVRLRHYRIGGRIKTRPEWVAEFIEALTRSRSAPGSPSLSAAQEASTRIANAALAATGW